jgi:N-acetylglucosamine-6-sulfatase
MRLGYSREAALLVAALALFAAFAPAAAIARKQRRPNFVFVLTDDQDVGTLRRVKGLPRNVRFSRMAAAFPLCCPSRATFITGQFGHNNGVRDNGQYDNLNKRKILPVWLKRAGYTTGYVGKYQGPHFLGKDDPGAVHGAGRVG